MEIIEITKIDDHILKAKFKKRSFFRNKIEEATLVYVDVWEFRFLHNGNPVGYSHSKSLIKILNFMKVGEAFKV